MKATLFVAVCLMITGCGGTTVDTVPPPVGDPAKVTPEIRAACGTKATDAQLADLIAAVETDRDSGFTRAEALASVSETCSQNPESAAKCETCMGAIVNAVYGPS
ncbi:MAG: hypothetical protein ACPMAQ_07500 [Phycisphaerae bacterium]